MKKCLLWCLLLLSGFVHAGFEEAVRAYEANDFAGALRQARPLAQAGDARANFMLGQMYQLGEGVEANPAAGVAYYRKAAEGGLLGAYSRLARAYVSGDGVARDLDAALYFARIGAKHGDEDAKFMVYRSLIAGPLGYLDASGKLDDSKYQQLARRPISERKLDTEALDALYYAVEKGHPQARQFLAMLLGETLGDGNRLKLLDLLSKLPAQTKGVLAQYATTAREMGSLGISMTSPRLFIDAQRGSFGGIVRTCGVGNKVDRKEIAGVKLVSTSVSMPPQGAKYLPTTVPGFEKATMLEGTWEETWTYEGCGRQAWVVMRFKADGLGGASFISQVTVPEKDGTIPSDK